MDVLRKKPNKEPDHLPAPIQRQQDSLPPAPITFCLHSVEVGLSFWADPPGMIDPYDPIHPDGADDPDDLPGAPPLTSISWLDDDDEFESEWISDFRPHLEDRA
jgi:hypothetical protein